MNEKQATHLEVEAEVRYWEDANVNGVIDDDGTLIPGRDGDIWKARIDLDAGRIVGWPEGIEARIHYKVCDQGEYWLTDAAGARIAKWRSFYVPDEFLCPGDSGYGDYIIMDVAADGSIAKWSRPAIDPEHWGEAA
ncbi:MAG: hypothetical protein LBV50_06950 [Novosphingobium sp.]|jgi:hypothetical protein|nr:hypothetical protein [Novosphingobium sp.]